ncbi:MAG: molybdopterin-dependent oxidoreductase [Actinomycetota bacterium]|nr:molybdopterin-dependent oxidoreductase [Actinomycetota bacterium]
MTDVTPRPKLYPETASDQRTGPGPGPAPADSPTSRLGAAVDGVVAGGVALGLATLLAGVLTWVGAAGGTPSPVPAVGGAFVDRTPPWLKDFAVNAFATDDKLALFTGMAVVLAALCAGIGLLSRTRRLLSLVLLAVVGALGMAAVMSRPNAGAPDILPTLLGTAAGIDVLVRLRRDSAEPTDPGIWSPLTRRRVIAGGGAALAAVIGSRISGGGSAARESRAEAVIPTPVTSATTAVTGTSVDVPGVTPFVVPNDAFYRIDTALVVPQLDTATWSLRVWGEVDKEVTIDWKTLLQQQLEEHMVTLTCVSNEVGGDLIGNATWIGWPVRNLLAMAGPKAGADMVLSRSSDGFTAGTPIEALTDDRNALIAVAMNGQALPFEHGFPARLVVPGLYGYVSATKWVTELKVTRFSADQGYWTPRGWSAKGPIKTASRIDVPKPGATVAAGTVAIAGVAWAQHRGISTVEVQVDNGAWQEATLAGEATVDAWRQWVLPWAATSGRHTVRVRATDASGQTQPPQEAPPAPDGATGWHTVQVTVS